MVDIKDKIRGSMMAGAAGDALGFTVEFSSLNNILSQYGKDGIRKFEVYINGKARISDDTQMSLFTANGILWGTTCENLRGFIGNIEDYVERAYLDWYYTQTGKKDKSDSYCTWLRNLPAMAQLRAPGCTCMDACNSLLHGKEVYNDSKGCGGIMRVAPMALFAAAENNRNENTFNTNFIAYTGSEIARITHKHPLAFLPSAMMCDLVYRLAGMDEAEARDNISDMVMDTIDTMKKLYPDEFEDEKNYLAALTEKAVTLAANNCTDAENIRSLGEGWVGEEAWAIAVYCAIRHSDSVEEAIIASVNHDGDSDSTGAVTGNIMGAIYGYEHIRERKMFCPEGRDFEDTLELSEIILALADDMYKGCNINEHNTNASSENKQWLERYCKMEPAGISDDYKK